MRMFEGNEVGRPLPYPIPLPTLYLTAQPFRWCFITSQKSSQFLTPW